LHSIASSINWFRTSDLSRVKRLGRFSRARLGGRFFLDATIGLLPDRFGIDLDEETRAAIFSARDFISLSDEQTSGLGRNDPCRCGGEIKFKRCHGS